MNWMKGFALATCLATPISVIVATSADAEVTSPAATARSTQVAAADVGAKKPTPEIFAKCSKEADAKGLFAAAGKGEARKAFRASCIRKAIGAS